MILIGLGSNVEGPWGTPANTIHTALKRLDRPPTRLVRASRLVQSKPMGGMDQPNYVNAVAVIATELSAVKLMQHLHEIELDADRRRSMRWAPRTLDLDILDYNGVVRTGQGTASGHRKPLELPHPGIADRAFVLLPLLDVAPDWKHPVSRKSARQLIDELAPVPGDCVYL